MRYNWQQKHWPKFQYDLTEIKEALNKFEDRARFTGKEFNTLPEKTRHDTILNIMVTEAVKTSAIEGEYISRQDVMSSIRNQLGLNLEPQQVRDRRAKGAAQLMLTVRNTFDDSLTEAMLFNWHRMLLENSTHIAIGAWRTHQDAMQVISESLHKPIIHFEAPPSNSVPAEMNQFINWFNRSAPGQADEMQSSLLRSALAHLYFESIHPFEDGNGRIGRAISEKALSQGLGYPVIISLSKTIESNKKQYYNALETAQRSNEVTEWVHYFTNMALDAQTDAECSIDFILKKTKFFDKHLKQLDEHQLKVINRMFEEGPKGFEGGMSAKKYSAITGVSKATATRHLQHLKQIGAFIQEGTGRSTRYQVNL